MKIGAPDAGGGFRGVYACGVGIRSRDPANMRRLSEKGYAGGQKIEPFARPA